MVHGAEKQIEQATGKAMLAQRHEGTEKKIGITTGDQFRAHHFSFSLCLCVKKFPDQ